MENKTESEAIKTLDESLIPETVEELLSKDFHDELETLAPPSTSELSDHSDSPNADVVENAIQGIECLNKLEAELAREKGLPEDSKVHW
jgi:hypothetical protein